jgi:flavin reductase (DIM6/NTAB) family NADH-FMN oxidoreductase RutF
MTKPDPISTVLERIPYGVFVAATSPADSEIFAIIATWVMQVSFTPPLIAIALENEGELARMIEHHGTFSLSLVPEHGIPTAKKVLKAGPRFVEGRGAAIFAKTVSGIPKLTENAGVLECRVLVVHDTGDHLLTVAAVEGCESPHAAEMLPLKQTGWKYRKKKTNPTT